MKSILDNINIDGLFDLIISKFQYLNIKPRIGIEFEFNIVNSNQKYLDFIDDINLFAINRGIDIMPVEKEASNDQFEIIFNASYDIDKLIDDINKLKEITNNLAQNYNFEINFNGYAGDDFSHGNGLHIHISLYDNENKNLYIKKNKYEESKFLLKSLAGLLFYMNDSLILINSEIEDFKRYKARVKINEEDLRFISNASYAPTHICWGINNRTTALRVISNSNESHNRRIEHRLSSPNCDIKLSISLILLEIYFGIKNNLKPIDPIYGNAFDEQYELEAIINDQKLAIERFENSKLKNYLYSIDKIK